MPLVDLELNLSLNRYKKLLWELTLQHLPKTEISPLGALALLSKHCIVPCKCSWYDVLSNASTTKT